MIRYQTSSHGCNRFSVQVFDDKKELISDANIVREVNGWKVVTLSPHDGPQHRSVKSAARWYAEQIWLERQTA